MAKPSIEPVGVVDQHIPEMELSDVPSSLFAYSMDCFRKVRSQFRFDADCHAYRIGSFVTNAAVDGLPKKTRHIENISAQSVEPNYSIRKTEIKFDKSDAITTYKKRDLYSYPILQNPIFGFHDTTLYRYDMAAVYAKIAFYAFLRQRFKDEGIEPVYANIDTISNKYKYNDVKMLDAVQAAVEQTRLSYKDKGIIVMGISYSEQDDLFYHILGYAGAFMQSPESRRIIPASQYEWPAIPVTIFRNGRKLNFHMPNDISAEALWDFLFRLAAMRGECSSAVRGIYRAIELAFAHYEPLYQKSSHKLCAVMDSFSQFKPSLLSLPVDNSWRFLAAGVFKPNEQIPSEFNLLKEATTTDRQYAGLLVNNFIQAMTATTFYSCNIKGGHLQQLVVQETNSTALETLALGEFFGDMFSKVAEAIFRCTGHSMPMNWNIRNWNFKSEPYGFGLKTGPYGCEGNAETVYKLIEPMSIDNFLVRRPREWGISTPSPVDIQQLRDAVEFRLGAFQAAGGLQAETVHPFQLDTQQIFCINAFLQICPYKSWPELYHHQANRLPTNELVNGEKTKVELNYYKDLCVMEPLTLFTYDYGTNSLFNNVLIGKDAAASIMSAMLNIPKGIISRAGLFLRNLSQNVFPALPLGATAATNQVSVAQ